MSGKEDAKGQKTSLFKSGSRIRILNEANQCWSALLRCKECKSFPSHFMNTPGHQFHQWSLTLFCNACKSEFHVCTICRGNKKQFSNYQDLKKHMYLQTHMKKLAEIKCDSS